MDKNLSTRVQQALDEARTLMLTTQVLLGFEMKAVFENGFDALDRPQQYLVMGALAMLVASVAFLLATSAWHQVCKHGGDSHDTLRMTTRLVALAMLPMAFSLGVNMYISAVRVTDGQETSIAFGVGGLLLALFFWYGWELAARRSKGTDGGILLGQSHDSADKDLAQKIDHVLTECRMVLPGAQALLGFQFITVLQESFEKMPPAVKYVHLASIALVAIATVLLMMPAAYHRIVEGGEETRHFLEFARWPLMIAMGFLAAGISSGLFVVVIKVTASVAISMSFASAAFLSMVGMWFGWPVIARSTHDHREAPRLIEAR